jgi:hypothetical protein
LRNQENADKVFEHKKCFKKMGCMMISSHEVLQKEKKDRQKSYYNRIKLIREGKLKPMPESRMSLYGPVRDISIKLSIPKFNFC